MSEQPCEHLIGLANNLALEDLAHLIEINRDRICVFNEGTATVDNLSITNNVCMNGASIQLTVNDREGGVNEQDR